MIIQEPVAGELVLKSDLKFVVRYRIRGTNYEQIIWASDPLAAAEKLHDSMSELPYVTGCYEANSLLALLF